MLHFDCHWTNLTQKLLQKIINECRQPVLLCNRSDYTNSDTIYKCTSTFNKRIHFGFHCEDVILNIFIGDNSVLVMSFALSFREWLSSRLWYIRDDFQSVYSLFHRVNGRWTINLNKRECIMFMPWSITSSNHPRDHISFSTLFLCYHSLKTFTKTYWYIVWLLVENEWYLWDVHSTEKIKYSMWYCWSLWTWSISRNDHCGQIWTRMSLMFLVTPNLQNTTE